MLSERIGGGRLIAFASENGTDGESVSTNLLDAVSENLAAPAETILEAAGTSGMN